MKPTELTRRFQAQLQVIGTALKSADIQLPEVEVLESMLMRPTFDVAFIGEFTSGKTTIVNAILGASVLPTRLEPTTARVTNIVYSDQPRISLRLKNGTQKSVPYSADYLKSLIASHEEIIKEIESIDLGFPSDLLRNGIRLIDTPGTNDPDEQRVGITYRILPECDAVVYVSVHPITNDNLDVYKTHILGNNIAKVFYILNQTDLIGSDLDEAMKEDKQWLEQTVGNEIILHPMSAENYVEYIQDGDQAIADDSGFSEFLRDLTDYLNGSEKFAALDRRYTLLVENLRSKSIELFLTRIASLILSEGEYNERKTQLEKQLTDYSNDAVRLSEDVDAEFSRLIARLEDSVNELFIELLSRVESYLDQPSNSDPQLLMRQIEMAIKSRFDEWRRQNEPIVAQYVDSIRSEIQARMSQVVNQMGGALLTFRGGVDLSPIARGDVNTDPLSSLIKDPAKAQATFAVAGVGTYVLLAVAGITIAPVALLIAPIGMYLMNKNRKGQMAAAKSQVLIALREEQQSFRTDAMRSVYEMRDAFLAQIKGATSKYGENIRDQIKLVDKQRSEAKISLEDEAKRLGRLLEEIREA